jgi:hypothetical protein
MQGGRVGKNTNRPATCEARKSNRSNSTRKTSTKNEKSPKPTGSSIWAQIAADGFPSAANAGVFQDYDSKMPFL